MDSIHGNCYASEALPGRSTEPRDLVPHEPAERRDRNHPEERPREIHDSTTDMGSAAEQNLPSPESTPMCTPNVLMVDFTGFEFHEDFFIKELALFQPFNKACWVGTFQKPFSNHSWNKKMLKTTEIQTQTIHGLRWDDGQYPYHMLSQLLYYLGQYHIFYVKNAEKANVLQHVTDFAICHLQNVQLSSSSRSSYCQFHDPTQYYCALDHAVGMGQCFVDMFSFKTM